MERYSITSGEYAESHTKKEEPASECLFKALRIDKQWQTNIIINFVPKTQSPISPLYHERNPNATISTEQSLCFPSNKTVSHCQESSLRSTMSDNSSSAIASSSFSTGSSGDQVNDNVVGVPVPSSSSSHESSSASGSGALANVTIAPKEQTSDFGDTCTWYVNAQCYTPRNCYDCINVALRRDECAVDPRGMCVSMSTYRRYRSMQSNASDQGFSGYFPAANFTYCSVMDATCNACKTKWREQYWSTSQSPAPAICRGDNGCICISSCEMPNRVKLIIMDVCTLMGFDTTKLATVAYVGAAMVAAMILSVIGLRAYTKKRAIADRAREEQERLERRERRRQLLESRQRRTGPPLALNAWNSLRDKLLESERGFIQGGKPSLAEPGVQTTQAIERHEQVLDGEGGGRDGEEVDSIRREERLSSRRSGTDL